MEKIIIKKGINNSYDLFIGNQKQIDLDSLTEKCANMLKALALIHYIQDFNNKQSEFYKRNKEDVCKGITYLFNNNANCKTIFKYFGIKPNKNELQTIVALTNDVCNCKQPEINMHLAMKCFNINEKVKELENEITK